MDKLAVIRKKGRAAIDGATDAQIDAVLTRIDTEISGLQGERALWGIEWRRRHERRRNEMRARRA